MPEPREGEDSAARPSLHCERTAATQGRPRCRCGREPHDVPSRSRNGLSPSPEVPRSSSPRSGSDHARHRAEAPRPADRKRNDRRSTGENLRPPDIAEGHMDGRGKDRLLFMCGKMAAGKSTLSRALAEREHGVLLVQDDLLEGPYPGEFVDFPAFLKRSARLRATLAPHVVSLLCLGMTVVLDFPANTRGARARPNSSPVGYQGCRSALAHEERRVFAWLTVGLGSARDAGTPAVSCPSRKRRPSDQERARHVSCSRRSCQEASYG